MPSTHINLSVLLLARVYGCYRILDAILIGLGKGGRGKEIRSENDGVRWPADGTGPTGELRPDGVRGRSRGGEMGGSRK